MASSFTSGTTNGFYPTFTTSNQMQNRVESTIFSRPSFTGKELDEETGYGYFGARYYDPTLLTSWTAVDPMSDKYPSLSPYNYCAWNPMKLVDPDGRDVYRLDASTGSLKLYQRTKDKTDIIESGTYSNVGRTKNVWTRQHNITISKGVLKGEKGEDLSINGFVTHGGNQKDGLRAAKFISFECFKELSGMGFSSKDGGELDVFGWSTNTSREAHPGFLDRNTDSRNLQFSFHTHPGDRNGSGGRSVLDGSDKSNARQNRQLYGVHQNYIITRKDGIMSYNEWNIIPNTIGLLPQTFRGL